MRGFREITFYLSVGVGMAMSTSVFTMLAGLFGVVSPLWVVIAIALGAAVSLPIAAAIGELASMYPSAPGIRTYLKHGLGDRPSLVLVYMYLFVVVMVAGVEAAVFAAVVHTAAPAVPAVAIVIATMVLVIIANCSGFELPVGVQMWSTFAILGLVLWAGALGIVKGDPSRLLAQTTDWSQDLQQLPAAGAMSMFLFMGYEWITPVGLRPQAYRKGIPYSMLGTIGILAVTFSLFSLGLSCSLDAGTIAASAIPQVMLLSHALGETGVICAVVISAAAILSTFNAGIMGGSRLINALAKERCLPSFVGYQSLTSGAPIGAILTLGGLSLASALVVAYNGLELVIATIGAALICVVYAAFVLALLRLRKSAPQAPRSFRARFALPGSWLLVLALPVMGASALLADAKLALSTSAGAGALTLFALLAADRSLAQKAPRSNSKENARNPVAPAAIVRKS